MKKVQLNLNIVVLYMDLANFANFAFLQYTIQVPRCAKFNPDSSSRLAVSITKIPFHY